MYTVLEEKVVREGGEVEGLPIQTGLGLLEQPPATGNVWKNFQVTSILSSNLWDRIPLKQLFLAQLCHTEANSITAFGSKRDRDTWETLLKIPP